MDSSGIADALAALLPIALEKEDARSVFALKFHRFLVRDKLKIPPAENPRILSELEAMAAENRWDVERVVAHHYAAFEAYSTKQMPHEQMYAEVLRTFERMEKIGFEKFRDYEAEALLYHLGRFMWDLDDFEKSHRYLSVAEQFVRHDEAGGYHLTVIYNLLQSYYQKKKDYPKAIEYAQKLCDYHKNQHSDDPEARWRHWFWQGLALLDIAAMRIEQGDLAEGERYAAMGYELSRVSDPARHYDSWYAEFDALQVLLSIRLKTGRLDEATALICRSEELTHLLDNAPHITPFRYLKFYKNCAHYHELKQQFGEAVRFSRLAQNLQDSLDRRNDARKFEQLQRRMDAERYQEHIRLVEREKQQQSKMFCAALLVLLAALALGWVKFSRIRAKRRLALAELQTANDRLAALAAGFQEKSALLERMRLEAEKMAAHDERGKLLEKLSSSTVLTQDDWQHFRAIFEQVYPGFIKEQSTLYASVTAAELRLLVFEKLGLSDRETANLLGISYTSVQQTRWRMRKKKLEVQL